MRGDCTTWLSQVELKLPSVVLSAKTTTGVDRVDLRVRNGRPGLSGHARRQVARGRPGTAHSFYCATPALVKGVASYSVTLAADAPAPFATVTGENFPTDERTDDCGLAGLTAITDTTGLADSFVEGLGNHCGTSAVMVGFNLREGFWFDSIQPICAALLVNSIP
jgi:hypothetical protein